MPENGGGAEKPHERGGVELGDALFESTWLEEANSSAWEASEVRRSRPSADG